MWNRLRTMVSFRSIPQTYERVQEPQWHMIILFILLGQKLENET